MRVQTVDRNVATPMNALDAALADLNQEFTGLKQRFQVGLGSVLFRPCCYVLAPPRILVLGVGSSSLYVYDDEDEDGQQRSPKSPVHSYINTQLEIRRIREEQEQRDMGY